jgi:uncharacterized protein (TIGR00369 family)
LADIKRRASLAELNQLIKENRVAEYTSPNLALGMKPIEFGTGSSRWEWAEQPPSALNPFGTIQGGYLAIFIDELFSTAIASVLEDGEWAMTAEFKVSFLRALQPATLEGKGTVQRRSRTLAFLEAQVIGADGRVAATASSTWAISRG